jgi:hypothetical protein
MRSLRIVHAFGGYRAAAGTRLTGDRLLDLLRAVTPLILRITPEEVDMLIAGAAQAKARGAGAIARCSTAISSRSAPKATTDVRASFC